MSIEEVEREIVDRISKVEKILKIILFGSYAYGGPTGTSDIDLLVVINKDEYPTSFKEKSENYLKISRAIRPIEKRIPVDLLVYTKPEFEKFIELGSMFSRKIIREGKELS
ncbi:nucleotidyltransferase domain-containing protein [Nitrospira defluvii]|nr:nucleotidyltransferase domain-containing protein [Nitrospira defluvii]